MSTNEIKLNGVTVMSTRGDSVNEKNLLLNETATNSAGEKIKGELDPVTEEELDEVKEQLNELSDDVYKVSDEEGEIEETDYIPFNDISDVEKPKKKTLLSSIIEKLKSTFLSKTWGHVELIQNSETLRIKDTQIDATESDNGVTAIHYPSSNDIVDNNSRILSRYEAVVKPNGDIYAKMYARNYDTNGNTVGSNSIEAGVDKSGNSFYYVADPNKFRKAINTIDQMGTRIPANSDLDDYVTAGTYYVENNTDAGTISNMPFGVAYSGKLIVLDMDSNVRVDQIYITNYQTNSLVYMYIRQIGNDGVARPWREITAPHTYEDGTAISADSDLNDYKTAGVYTTTNDTIASSIANIPSPTTGKLIVSYSAPSHNYIQQIYIVAYNNAIYTRFYDNWNLIWSEWKQLATTDDITPANVGNGYAEATVSGSAITATITGFKLRAGVILALKITTTISSACTLNINNTGAKTVTFWDNQNPSVGKPIRYGINLFMYDGTYYRCIGFDRTPMVGVQDYVADTSGNELIEWGYGSNKVQLKHSIGNNKLRWNYYKNSAWRGDRNIVEEIEDGIIQLFRNTTTTEDAGVGLRASIKDTTTGKTYTRDVVKFYQDHQATPYGFNLLLDSGGETYIGAGEGAINIYNARTNKTSENLFLVADGNVYFYGNANTIADRQGFKLTNTGKLLPSIAEVDTDNFGNIGDSATMWQGVYAHNMFLHSPQGRTVVGGAHSLGVSDTIPNILNELRFSNGAWGSFNLTTAYTKDYTTIPTGWYNYFYIPHRVGGENWATPTTWDADNVSYGTLMIFGMNNTNGSFILRTSTPSGTSTPNVYEITDINKGNCYVGTCTTAGGTKDKVATVDGNFVLRKGVRVAIKFSNSNTYSNVTSSPITLNVNGTGAKNIWYNTTHSGAGNTGTSNNAYGLANRYNFYMYDGTYWVWDSKGNDDNTTYSNQSLGNGYGTCTTAEATTAKVVTLSGYNLTINGYVSVKFTNAVPANATMNINSKGAKNIWYRGANITANVIKAGDLATFIYDGTRYQLVANDRYIT